LAIVYSPTDGLDCDTETGDRAIWILQPDHAPPDSIPFLKHLESNIFTNILARFMDLGQKETGARATAEIQDDPFYLGLLAVARNLCDAWNRGPIQRWVDMNYPGVDQYPELVAEGIAPIDVPIIASAAQAYAAVGMLTPDFATEQWVRKQLNAPDKIITNDYSVAGQLDANAISGDATESGATELPGLFDLAKQSMDLARKALAAGGSGTPSAAKIPLPALPREPKAGARDSGSGTSLAEACGLITDRLLRDADTAAAHGPREISALRAKDLGLLGRLGVPEAVGAYFGVRIEGAIKEQALMKLADPTHDVEKAVMMDLGALISHVQRAIE